MNDFFKRISIIKGDITKIQVDVIINAANTSLLGGGGVDGAIHRCGGNSILEECSKIRAKKGGCKIGESVITTAGNLPAKYVIHAVGPVWQGGNFNEELILKKTYESCLLLIEKYKFKSVSFPNISTGRYGFPKNIAAIIAIKAVINELNKNRNLEMVNFVCHDLESYNIYFNLIEDCGIIGSLQKPVY
ncbi:macro domain-containing protein [Testudinibacter sp. TR-2022]|uniref:macro domain-containing protein n=1 Tax=Testudinibacter sp. TR-2022 TaxID=2585029 RepID=UPI00111B8DD2|nr:macro domain-containing protein [Testudinibacter sp. TR-2022]TNH02481.1 macro domain-containing protein [Pasteurellaceae bacterium Phil11]TNH19411.1 macro domain-containing protein [Testudinibacter sp. TR-2022]TNH21930.1 macro domain-containing protein [Testudinibacter sp. TR-2022]